LHESEWSRPFSVQGKTSFYLRLPQIKTGEAEEDGPDSFLFLVPQSRVVKTNWVVYDDDGSAPYTIVNSTSVPLKFKQEGSSDCDLETLNPGFQVHYAWTHPNGAKRLAVFGTPVCISEPDTITTFIHDGRVFSCEVQLHSQFRALVVRECKRDEYVNLDPRAPPLVEKRSPLSVRSLTVFSHQKKQVEFVCVVKCIEVELEVAPGKKFGVMIEESLSDPAAELRLGLSCVSSSFSLNIANILVDHKDRSSGDESLKLFSKWFDHTTKTACALFSGELEQPFLRFNMELLRSPVIRHKTVVRSLLFSMHPFTVNANASAIDSILSVVDLIPSHEEDTGNRTMTRRPKRPEVIIIENAVISPVVVNVQYEGGSHNIRHTDAINLISQLVGSIQGGIVQLVPMKNLKHLELKQGLGNAIKQWIDENWRSRIKELLSSIQTKNLLVYAVLRASHFLMDDYQ